MTVLSAAYGVEAAVSRLASCEPAALRLRTREVLDLAVALFGVTGAIIEQSDGDDLVYAVASQAFADREGFRLRRAGSLSGVAVQTGEAQYCADAELDRRVDRAACQALGLRSMVCSPIGGARPRVLKFMANTPNGFDPERLGRIAAFSDRLGSVLQEREISAHPADLAPHAPPRPAVIVGARESEAIAVSSRRLLDTVEHAGLLGWWTLDPTNLHMRWSEGLYRLLGADSRRGVARLDDLLGWTHPADQPALHKLLTDASWTDAVIARIRGANGGQRWVRFHRDLRPAEERVYIGMAEDISVLQGARMGLTRYHGAFEALAKLTGGMIWRADPQGSLSFELGWCAYTGTTLAQNQGDGWVDQLHPDDRASAALAWSQALAASTPFAARFRVRRHDGVYELFDSRALAQAGDLEWMGVTMPVVKETGEAASSAEGEGACCPSPRELKAMRALANWTVEDLAVKSGVSASTITRYEREDLTKNPIRAANLDRLAQTLSARGLRVAQQGGHRSIVQAVSPAR